MSRAIHFSHHACGQWFAFTREQHMDYQREHGDQAEPYAGCITVRDAGRTVTASNRKQRTTRPALTTTDPARVTCQRCLDALAGRGPALDGFSVGAIGDSFPGHREQMKRAWLTCCSHRGAAWPLGADELAAVNREQLIKSIGDQFYAAWSKGIAAGYDPVDEARELRSRCADLAAELERHGLLEAMRPALDELLLMAEWHEQIEACFGRAFAARDVVLERIRSGELGYPDSQPGNTVSALEARPA